MAPFRSPVDISEMKLRHTAALGLVGWYLMQPPRGGLSGDQFYLNDPFSKSAGIGTDRLTRWRKFGKTEYASKEECDAERQGWKSMFPAPGNIPPERVTARIMVRGMAALQCFASGDSRLKLIPATPVPEISPSK
jgi:hypothetical protein